MGALWAGVAVAAGSAIYGASQNSKAQGANEDALNLSREDYRARLIAGAKMAKELNAQYNEIVGERPDLSWESFVGDKIKSLNDPWLREAYTNAKKEDFDRWREFAERASVDNVENLESVADELSNGKWQDIIDQRNKLVLETNAADRYARSYELAAPVRTGASTVRYDNEGRLIEGQRADKQAFNIATEVQTAVEQEQKQDLRQLETDRLSAAERQSEKARDYMQWFDGTGYATAAEADRSKLLHGYQQTDEERAFRLFEMFAGASAGITPVAPAYQNSGPGNQLIASGVQLAGSTLSAYGNQTKQTQGTTPKSTY